MLSQILNMHESILNTLELRSSTLIFDLLVERDHGGDRGKDGRKRGSGVIMEKERKVEVAVTWDRV